MKTRITELFGIEYPIICGGMLWLAVPELCAAISNAGGLGNITACNYDSGEDLRAAIQQTRQLTSKPIGVNITLMPSMRFTEEIYDDFFKVCAEEKIEVIEVSGKPAIKYLDMLHKAGVKVMHKVGAVRHAKNIERFGYDAVIAAGIEEGGHPLNDDVTTMVLLPRIVESVNIPVISTGGIVDGRSLAAALSLGAEGVLMATRFIATKECAVHPNIWQELIDRQENDTTLICKSVGLQGRALKNDLTRQVLEIEEKGADLGQIIPLLSGQKSKQAWVEGDVNAAALMVGQSIGLIKEVTTCAELIQSMVKDAEAILTEKLACFK
ncbi:MAG TPA: nitronate monooxygenase [Syntrophomonadaceae bacterium]|jgi:NAD(P)H-dependent flavin oxidoreductase YrpB (nitropropane dioxygenase family)|nr:nitronate monooxygenase [Syntrophomonadaceae bacterium]HRX20664.1 nitronate monooxygenase [Syntrophomonadaceae bacterium]